jgi:hypothetical protein
MQHSSAHASWMVRVALNWSAMAGSLGKEANCAERHFCMELGWCLHLRCSLVGARVSAFRCSQCEAGVCVFWRCSLCRGSLFAARAEAQQPSDFSRHSYMMLEPLLAAKESAVSN